MKLGIVASLIASLFGCSKKPDVSDGPGMEYHDSDYRSKYFETLDFDGFSKGVYFAIADLDKESEGEDACNMAVARIFSHLPEKEIEEIKLFDFGGENRYLVIPRYRDYCNIRSLVDEREYTAYNGEAFIVRCDESSVEVSIDSHGGQKFIIGTVSECVADIAQK